MRIILFMSLLIILSCISMDTFNEKVNHNFEDCSGMEINGKREGVWKCYSTGAPWESYHYNEISYHNGLKHGFYKSYDSLMVLRRLNSFANGIEHGISQYFNEKGKLLRTEIYDNGYKKSIVDYYENGFVQKTGSYVTHSTASKIVQFDSLGGENIINTEEFGSVKEGLWKYFFIDGNVEKEIIYEKDSIINIIEN